MEQVPQAEIYGIGKRPETAVVRCYDFNQGVDYKKIIQSFATTGLQASNLASAIDILNEAIKWRLSD